MTGQYVKVCALSDMKEGDIMTVEVNGRPIVLVRYEGTIYALDDLCTHDGGSLGDGGAIGAEIVCPRHGARFDIKTGAATRMPAVFGIQTYDVKVEGNVVYVGIEA
ncbi:MAG: non-heme iron oxygenase ferredoxin subunit [candidate division Zixibacteria bacterium]|nr:non-heme iron oxygenase ferredoxin subunit [candidate division Zixibacteria bacterium]